MFDPAICPIIILTITVKVFFFMGLTFKSVDWVEQIILRNVVGLSQLKALIKTDWHPQEKRILPADHLWN